MKEKITLRFLTENYYNKIYRKLLRSLSYDQSTAEDITQDVFLELCKKWGTMKKSSEAELASWLYVTAQNKLSDRYRKLAKEKHSLAQLDENEVTSKERDLDEEIVNSYVLKNMDAYEEKILSALSDDEIALAAYLRKGIKYAEIGKRMEISEAAVTSRVYRLVHKVRKAVAEEISKIP